MTLLVLDALETAPLVQPLREGWIGSEVGFELRERVTAADVAAEDAALLPAAEIAFLTETHAVAPSIAVVCDGVGTVAMRVPVRPDEIEQSDVRLYDATPTAELLARATLEPFYGIQPRQWIAGDAPEAQVVIVDGAEALRPPEVGFSEDLVRAWFILTGLPVVTHLLAVPKQGDPSPAISLLEHARAVGHERRRDLRRAVAERFGVDRERLIEIAAARRYALDEADRRALLLLLQRGNKGSDSPYVWQLDYVGEAPTTAVE